MTENPKTPQRDREKMTEIMFEAYKVPFLYVALQAVLSLFMSGRVTGIVCDSGHRCSFFVPIYEGYAISNAVTQSNFAGHNLTYYLMKLLQKRDFSFVTNAEYELVREIKEKLCYVALDFEKDLQSSDPSAARESTYELPDGQLVNIGKACFECPEVLFKPHLMGISDVGIHESCCNSIKMCVCSEFQASLFRDIVLSGGNTMFPGIVERFKKEMTDVAPPTVMIKVANLPERKHPAWEGGSMLASLSTFKEMAISKAEYDEWGPILVQRKCF